MMELHEDQNHSQYLIEDYSDSHIQINQQSYTNSLIISPSELISDWPINSLDNASIDHLQKLADLNPDIVIIGTGKIFQLASADIKHFFKAKNIALETMTTAAACRTYSAISSEARRVVVGLII